MSALGDRRLIRQAGVALVVANARFWPNIAPLVAAQLQRWELHAREIRDPCLRALAREKLTEERFNSEVAATLATLAPRKHRSHVVEAIVAYEVMYDYLDGLTEQPSTDPMHNGQRLYAAFTDAVRLRFEPRGSYYQSHPQHEDSGYLEQLVSVVRSALAQLPAAATISNVSERAAARCAEAQIRAHAVPRVGTAQLEAWASREAAGTPLGWQEFLAGAASSVLAVHALIVAASDIRTTTDEAAQIDTMYLSICALSTMLDSLIDYEQDHEAGEAGYVRYYQDHDVLAKDLIRAARRAARHAAFVNNGPHHLMTLVGVASYYASAPAADSDFARPVTRRVCSELQPLITPTLAVMRAWRAAKRLRHALRSSTR